MFRAAYRFFDQAFVVESDSPSFLERFDAAYGRFGLSEAPEAPIARVLLGGNPQATIGGQTIHVGNAAMLEMYATNAILHDAMARVRSHFLFHAAALRRPDGQGAILAGAAGLGKTTLTLELLRRGWGLLSDDVAAVDRSDGWLYPFPRSLAVRVPGGQPGEKRLIQAEAITVPCPAKFLFILADAGAGSVPDDPWYLALDRADEELIHSLRAVKGVREAQLVSGGPFSVVRLDLVPAALSAVENEVEAACRRHGLLLFDFVQGREGPPDFRGEPRLEGLSAADAGRELLAHLKGGRRSAVLHEGFGGSAARLFVALSGLAASMACFRLVVGRLAAMVEAIQRTAGQSLEPSGE